MRTSTPVSEGSLISFTVDNATKIRSAGLWHIPVVTDFVVGDGRSTSRARNIDVGSCLYRERIEYAWVPYQIVALWVCTGSIVFENRIIESALLRCHEKDVGIRVDHDGDQFANSHKLAYPDRATCDKCCGMKVQLMRRLLRFAQLQRFCNRFEIGAVLCGVFDQVVYEAFE